MRDRISMVRGCFRLLFLNGYSQEQIAEKILSGLTPRGRTKLPTVWSEDEIRRLLEGVDVANPNGKRNYAMLLLAARLGAVKSRCYNRTGIEWEKGNIFHSIQTYVRMVQCLHGSPLCQFLIPYGPKPMEIRESTRQLTQNRERIGVTKEE